MNKSKTFSGKKMDNIEKHSMEIIAQFNDQQRAEIFNETAAETGLPAAAIEKDFWACWALQKLFSDPVLSKQILFKGGTTLSKCYGLIDRFSEDIDLILDWTLLTNENPYAERSKTKQDAFNKQMESVAQSHIKNITLPQIEKLISVHCSLQINNDRPKSIMMSFPKAFDSPYIKPEVELEIGPMSAMLPKAKMLITPYCKNVTKALTGDLSFAVEVIQAKKTFWDKVTILHVESHRPDTKVQPTRYSRHYYDLYQMLNSEVKSDAMNDLALLAATVQFKDKFYPQGWAKYDSAKKGKFQLIPEVFRIKQLEADYKQMEEMIFGEYPPFEDILLTLGKFEKELNEAHLKS